MLLVLYAAYNGGVSVFNFGVGCHVCKRSISDAAFSKDARTGEAVYWDVSEQPPHAKLLLCSPRCALQHAQNCGKVAVREAVPSSEG